MNLKNRLTSILAIFILILIFSFIHLTARACSVFCIDKGNELVVGRNYDWGFKEGLIILNKRNHQKTAFFYWGENSSNLATWTSRYGSITFNQYGRDIAFSGMNETGLVVSELWLNETRYPAEDSRASLSVDQYVQYILDNFSSVDQIIASDSLIRLRPTTNDFTKIHFIAVDSSGKSAVIEFIHGKMVYHTGDDMPVKALTNNTYDASLAYLKSGEIPSPGDNSSLSRFYRASTGAMHFNPGTSGPFIDYAFHILQRVAQGNRTKYSMVFDIKNRKVYFNTLANQNIQYFDFGRFDFSCNTISKVHNTNLDFTGDINDKFVDYTLSLNEELILKAWKDLGYTDVYPPALKIISAYPETFRCVRKAL